MTFDLDAFAHLQARPNLVFGRPVRPLPPAPPIRYSGAPDIPLPTGLANVLASVPYPSSRESAPAGLDGLTTLLQSALGFQRYEPANNYNAHRAYPSAQSLFPVEAFVVRGQQAWHYDAARHALRPVGAADGDPAGQDAAIALLGRPGKLPEYYRELRWALTLCEAGHAAEVVAATAGALGYAGTVHVDFDDAGLLAAIGAESLDGWLPAAVIGLSPAAPGFPPSTPWEAPDDPVLAADRLAWSDAVALAPSPYTATATWAGSADVTWEHVLFHRSAGHSRGGFTASPAPLARQALAAALAASRAAAQRTWGGMSIRMCLAVERVEDLADGLYAWSPEDGDLDLLASGSYLAAVQDAYLYPATVTRVDTGNVALMFLVDYPAVAAKWGARGLRFSQLVMGALAQAAGLALTAHGAFLRPARSFDPDRLGEVAQCKPGETVGYLGLCGVSRLTDLMLDLRV